MCLTKDYFTETSNIFLMVVASSQNMLLGLIVIWVKSWGTCQFFILILLWTKFLEIYNNRHDNIRLGNKTKVPFKKKKQNKTKVIQYLPWSDFANHFIHVGTNDSLRLIFFVFLCSYSYCLQEMFFSFSFSPSWVSLIGNLRFYIIFFCHSFFFFFFYFT